MRFKFFFILFIGFYVQGEELYLKCKHKDNNNYKVAQVSPESDPEIAKKVRNKQIKEDQVPVYIKVDLDNGEYNLWHRSTTTRGGCNDKGCGWPNLETIAKRALETGKGFSWPGSDYSLSTGGYYTKDKHDRYYYGLVARTEGKTPIQEKVTITKDDFQYKIKLQSKVYRNCMLIGSLRSDYTGPKYTTGGSECKSKGDLTVGYYDWVTPKTIVIDRVTGEWKEAIRNEKDSWSWEPLKTKYFCDSSSKEEYENELEYKNKMLSLILENEKKYKQNNKKF
tara:strand:- start:72 stop:911 length:840 start_codon:yes stop_codon:yes gene_type:complete